MKIIKKYFSKQQPVPAQPQDKDLGDMNGTEFNGILELVRPYTMLSTERLYANYSAIKYVEDANIEGDIVECGVWKGGSSMCFAKYLTRTGSKRNMYLYDTFEGMSEPEDVDKKRGDNKNAMEKWLNHSQDGLNTWCYSPLDEVKENLSKTNYPKEYMHFIKGKVEDTLPNNHHSKIAILRLDTDWYSSTRHELIHLFPKLQNGGVLIIDDYGCWEGAQKAVDEYLSEHNIKILLNRIDNTGRMGIK